MKTLMKGGDWAVLTTGVLLIIWLFGTLWGGGAANKVIIRAGGKLFAKASLNRNRIFTVPGPLGVSIIIVKNHRVRVARDPGPRQYCVKQGWLSRAGEAAICLPNQVTVNLTGAKRLYDSLNY